MYRLSTTKVSAEENETTVSIDHYSQTFAVYTTASKVARMLKLQFPSHYEEAFDQASATANDVPVSLICKLRLSSLK